MKSLVLALAVLALPAFAEPVTVVSATQVGNLMPPVRPNAVATEFVLNVRSGGCTNDASFKANVVKQGEIFIVDFVRVVPDHCEAFFQDGTQITVRVGGIPANAQIVVKNPLFVKENFVY